MEWPKILNDDRKALIERYKSKAGSKEHFQSGNFGMVLFSWNHGDPHGQEQPDASIADLQTSESAAIRIIFAHRDTPDKRYVEDLTNMFERCEIPTEFISESFQDVSQSFGSRTDADSTLLWFHFLSKDIDTKTHNDRMCIVHPESRVDSDSVVALKARKQTHANFNWTKTGVVLRVRKSNGSPPTPNRTTTSSSGSSSTTIVSSKPEVDLYCFGPPNSFYARFVDLKASASHEILKRNPYMLIEIILAEMYKLLDDAGWSVARTFGPIETETLQRAQDKAIDEWQEVDFTGLHHLSKHAIYLQENCEAALATLECFTKFHKDTLGDDAKPSQNPLQQALAYRKTLFESTKRRLSSLEKRIANIVELSFNLVTQGDSRTMQSENKSMKTIAIMTLFFMPLSTVATVFGSEFFNQDKDGHVQTSPDIRVLGLIAGPLTFAVLVLWRLWYWDARAKLIGKLPGFGLGPVYLKVKQLKGSFRRQSTKQQQSNKGFELTHLPR